LIGSQGFVHLIGSRVGSPGAFKLWVKLWVSWIRLVLSPTSTPLVSVALNSIVCRRLV
jgi:hypothetical protein